jgi:hypothetical protein
VTATIAGTLVLVRFPGYALLRWLLARVGLQDLEDRAIAWVRARDQASLRA